MPIVNIHPEAMLHRPAPYVDMLQQAGFEVRYPQNPQLARGGSSEEELIRELQGASAVIATAEQYTERVLAALPELRVIARAGVGYDRVDIDAATRHNVAVTITPTANREAVAELALALLFAVTKRIVSNDRQVRSGQWPRQPLRPVRGNTMGIVGLGRIGRTMAQRCLALGMHVIALEQAPDESFVRQHGIELVDFEMLLARSDFISIHCPLTDQTHGMFDAEAFSKMRRGSVLINTARGDIVVEEALIEALRSGQLGGAGLDVFQQEPPATDNPLLAMDQVVVSPHIAGADEQSLEKMGIEAAECIIKLYRGQWPEGAVVNDQLKDGWKW